MFDRIMAGVLMVIGISRLLGFWIFGNETGLEATIGTLLFLVGLHHWRLSRIVES